MSLVSTPEIARLDAELARAQAILDLERANAIPDPAISVGLRKFHDTSDRAFVVGLALPIPVWNLNQGNIAKARHEVSKTESDKQAAALDLSIAVSRAAAELELAYNEAQSLKNVILPAAHKAFSLSRQGYQAGKLPYLEVLDAQRTLFDARSEYNAAVKNYHAHRAELERLTATYADTPHTHQKKERQEQDDEDNEDEDEDEQEEEEHDQGEDKEDDQRNEAE